MTKPDRTLPAPSRDAIRKQAVARRKRAYAAKLREQYDDATGARWEDNEAAELEAAAAVALEPRMHATGPLQLGRGGEFVVASRDVMKAAPGIISTIRQRGDMLAADASLERLDLASEAGVLTLGVDAADSIQAGNSLEQMLAHQLAALHVLTMKNAATAGAFAAEAADRNGVTPMQRRQIANVEANRSTNAATRASEAYQRGMLTLDRLRNGGRQNVVVQHVNVADGGQAVVAGAVQPPGGADK